MTDGPEDERELDAQRMAHPEVQEGERDEWCEDDCTCRDCCERKYREWDEARDLARDAAYDRWRDDGF